MLCYAMLCYATLCYAKLTASVSGVESGDEDEDEVISSFLCQID